MEILEPVKGVRIVDSDKLRPNDYNPNVVSADNLKLLTQRVMANGWTLPIVVHPDYTIIDGFHRWTVARREPLKSRLNGRVPVVIVRHDDEASDVYMNRVIK